MSEDKQGEGEGEGEGGGGRGEGGEKEKEKENAWTGMDGWMNGGFPALRGW